MPNKLGGEFRINTNTANSQWSSSLAVLSNGNVVVAWMSWQQDGSNHGVYGQMLNANGSFVGSEFRINTYITDNQDSPSLVALSNGNFVAAWQSLGQDGSGFGIYGQILNATGGFVGSEFRINTYTTNDQQFPSLVVLSDGNFVAAWQSLGQDGSGFGIYGQILNATGGFVGSEFQINTYTVNSQGDPSLAVLSNGNLVAVWDSDLQDGSSYGVYGQILNASGGLVGSEFPINTYTPNDQFYPSVAALSSGNFVVGWVSNMEDGSGFGIYGQMLNATGGFVGSEFRINANTTNDQWYPKFAALSNGNFVAVWDSFGQDDSNYGIYGQILTANGGLVGSEFQINTYTTNEQRYPSLAVLSNGNFLVAWSSDGQDGSYFGVYGQIFYGQIVASNINQSLNYLEDAPLTLSNFSILGALNENEIATTLTLSAAVAGALNTATSGSVTSTYTAVNGVWQALGDIDNVNNLLAGLVFTPIPDSYQNVTIGVNISDGASAPVIGTWNLAGIPVNDMPILVNNQLTLSEGQSFVLTSADLSATDVDHPAGSLVFTVSNVQNGRFELKSNSSSITSFTQQQIIDGEILFVHDDSEAAPAYKVSVSDGDLSTLPASANVTFIPVNDNIPVLGNNQLTITEGQAIPLTSANLSATDTDLPASTLIFTVSSVQHGRFELTSNLGSAISSFTQEQIANGEILFVHDDSEAAPAYKVSVSDGKVSTQPAFANVTFIPFNDNMPDLGNNQLTITEGQAIILTSDNLSATDVDQPASILTFTVSSVQHGRFELTSNPEIAISSFTQEQIAKGEIRFVHDGSEVAPAYEVSVSDGTFSTALSSVTVTFRKNQAPMVANPIFDQPAQLNQPFSFQIALDTFNDTDSDFLTYTAAQSGNSVLPNWLQFNNVTRFFSGTPTQIGILPVNVTASDPYGLTASTTFNINVQDLNGGLIGGIIGGLAAAGGLVGAAYFARGFFASSRQNKNTGNNSANASMDTEIELTKKTAISLAG